MESKKIKSINELISQLRLGEIDGTIELVLDKDQDVKKIVIRRQEEHKGVEEENTLRVVLDKKDLSHVDASGMEIQGDLSGFDLHETNFSYSSIANSSLAGAYLKNTQFYKAAVSQTDMSGSIGGNFSGSYMVGSVNLYNAQPSAQAGISNPYEGDASGHGDYEGGYDAEDAFTENMGKEMDPLNIRKRLAGNHRNY